MADHDERLDQHGDSVNTADPVNTEGADDPTVRKGGPDRVHGRTLAERIMDDEPTQTLAGGRDHSDDPTQVVPSQSDRTQPDRTQRDQAHHERTQVLDHDERTRVLAADQSRDEAAEQQRLEAARRADEERRVLAEEQRRRRAEAEAERQRRLGTVTPRPEPEAAPMPPQKRITDKFLGSLGLFLLRLVTAAIMGVHGFQKLTAIEDTTSFFSQLGLPSPETMAWVVGAAEVLAAISLLFGFLVRFAGLGIAAIAVGALILVKWGAENPFVAGQSGFVGELELLLAGVGLLFAAVGGGGWGLDASMRRGRARRRAAV